MLQKLYYSYTQILTNEILNKEFATNIKFTH